MRRKILLRNGGRCANPCCHHWADHCHYIVFRSDGGETVPSNEVALCATCHALIHAGLLAVEGRAGENLRWSARGESLTAPVREAGSAADRLPALRLESAYADFHFVASAERFSKSANADSRSPDLDLLAGALIRHGAAPLARFIHEPSSRNVADSCWMVRT